MNKLTKYPACLPYARIARSDISNMKKLIKGRNCHVSVYLYIASRCCYADTAIRAGDTWISVQKGEYLTTLQDLKKEFKQLGCNLIRTVDDLIHNGFLTMRMADSEHILLKVCGLKLPDVTKNCNGKPSRSGFILVERTISDKLLRLNEHASIADIYGDMLLHGVYMDANVTGSGYGVVAYIPSHSANGKANLGKRALAARYKSSPSTAHRLLSRLCELRYLTVIRLPGNNGSIYYLVQHAIKTELDYIPAYAVISDYGLDPIRDITEHMEKTVIHQEVRPRPGEAKPVYVCVDIDKRAGYCTDITSVPVAVHNHIDGAGFSSDPQPVSYGECPVSKSRLKKIERRLRKAFKYTAQRQPRAGSQPLIYVLTRSIYLNNHYMIREYSSNSYREILIPRKAIA